MLVIDVGFNEFKFFIREDAAFFWSESADAFILIKPRTTDVIRTVIMKLDEVKDEEFRRRSLYNSTAKYCLGFTIDGVAVGVAETVDEELAEVDSDEAVAGVDVPETEPKKEGFEIFDAKKEEDSMKKLVERG